MPNNAPTVDEYKAFMRNLKGMRTDIIINYRDNRKWGNWDPVDPRNSHWQVRAANRELTDRGKKRERRIQWIAIWFAFLTGWIAIVVAALAIPLERGKSVYCIFDPLGLCV
jgi:hypothetical protein